MLKTMRQAQDIIVAGKERQEEAAKQEAAKLEEDERQRLTAADGEPSGADSGAAALPAAEAEPAAPAEALAAKPENNDKDTPRG
jgi:hypothetical protein